MFVLVLVYLIYKYACNMIFMHGLVNDIYSCRRGAKFSHLSYLPKVERSDPKIVGFFRRKREVLFNISEQYYVIVIVHFVPTKF